MKGADTLTKYRAIPSCFRAQYLILAAFPPMHVAGQVGCLLRLAGDILNDAHIKHRPAAAENVTAPTLIKGRIFV
jgi:hypothetical protein